jgi:hypothetical protein
VDQCGGWVQVTREVRKLCGEKSVVIDRCGHGLKQLTAEGERGAAVENLLWGSDVLWFT